MFHGTAPVWGDKRLPERFWNLVFPCPNTGCWLWAGADDGRKQRYGRFRPDGERRYYGAHVVAYRFLVGEIPPKWQIDHRCRVHWCVNPAHLEAVTLRVNNLRGEGPAASNARRIACVNGHDFTPENTYTTPNGRRQCRACNRARTRAYAARKAA